MLHEWRHFQKRERRPISLLKKRATHRRQILAALAVERTSHLTREIETWKYESLHHYQFQFSLQIWNQGRVNRNNSYKFN